MKEEEVIGFTKQVMMMMIMIIVIWTIIIGLLCNMILIKQYIPWML